MNETEQKLSDYCKKNKWYCQKFLTHTVTGKGSEQVSDFLIANFEGVYFVEVKQRGGDLFELDGLTQKRKMLAVLKKTDKAKPYLLINYYKHNKLFLFDIKSYIELCNENVFKNGKLRKSLNYKNIPSCFEVNWKSILKPKDL